MSVARNVRTLLSQCRFMSTTTKNSDISPIFTNRNPRNLEKLRIAYKPSGWGLEKPGKCFWHKLVLTASGRYVTASVVHFENGEVLKASTQEWAIKKQLYGTSDSAAYINLARVLARRCLESGLFEIRCDIEPQRPDGKVALFLKTLTENGVKLQEPAQFKPWRPWDQHRPEKPWEVTE